MPYLHWETDRRRARAAQCMKHTSHTQMAAMDDVVDATATNIIEGTIERATSDGLQYNIPSTLNLTNGRPLCKPITNKTIKEQSLLGRMFLIAAALYEAMDSHTDEKLIERYLNSKPPLHPRRTLDQSYYWTLKDTRKRDRDQVVYRATAPNSTLMHHRCFKGVRGNKTVKQALTDGSIKPTCLQCLEDARRVPRIVMVDQLWMWVLDESKSFSFKLIHSLCLLKFQIPLLPVFPNDGVITSMSHPTLTFYFLFHTCSKDPNLTLIN